MKKNKQRLATCWFTGAGLLFVLLVILSNINFYEGKDQEVWGWFLPTIMPTLSLIIGVLVMDALGRSPKASHPDPFLFKLSMGLSCTYLGVVFLTIALQKLSTLSAIEMMHKSHLWLGPLQGLVAASLSAFFVNNANSAPEE
jgi:hypothetical protein